MPKEQQEEIEKYKQLKQEMMERQREEDLKREQMKSSQGKSTGAGGTGGLKKGAGQDRRGMAMRSDGPGGGGGENDVQIPSKLKDVIEESDEEYPIYFDDPEELIEIFSILEEKNLFLIQQGQEAE